MLKIKARLSASFGAFLALQKRRTFASRFLLIVPISKSGNDNFIQYKKYIVMLENSFGLLFFLKQPARQPK
ncbi:MAG: hypothetical protein WC756_05730 [Taibaiella sp.]|jgi:hypothetical protein